MKRWFGVVLLLLAWPGAAFGQTAVPTCPETPFEACGGDLTGSWTYAGIDCIALPDMSAQFGPSCTNVTTAVAADVSGTMTFNADNTWASHEVSNMAVTFVVPSACLPEGATCDAFANPAAIVTAVEGGCQLVINQSKTEDESGTYTTAGSTATMTDGEDPTDVDTANFCVQGDTTTVQLIDESGVRAIFTNTRVPAP